MATSPCFAPSKAARAVAIRSLPVAAACSAASAAGKMCIRDSDNGIGMTKEQLQGLRNALNRCGDVRTDSYGMCNVNDRIHILAGRKYGIEIVSEQNIGTSARMTLPKNLGGMQNVSGVDSR